LNSVSFIADSLNKSKPLAQVFEQNRLSININQPKAGIMKLRQKWQDDSIKIKIKNNLARGERATI